MEGGAASPEGRDGTLSTLLQAMVDAARDGVLAVSPDRRVLAVNRRFCELWRLPPDSVRVGGTSPALGDPQRSAIVDPDAFEAVICWGHQHPEETQALEVALRDGRVIEGYAAPIVHPDGSYLGRVWYLHDETERRAVEAGRAAIVDQLAAAQRAQRFLLDVSEALAGASGFTETVTSLAGAAVPTLGDLCLIDVVDERGSVSRVATAHADPSLRPLADRLRGWPPDPGGEHPSVAAMQDRRSRWSTDVPTGLLEATTRDAEHLDVLRGLDFASYMAVPLVADDRTLGAVTLVSSGSGRHFDVADLALAEDLARRVAMVVAKERRYDRVRSASHLLQTSLLSDRVPTPDGLSVVVRYLPGTLDAEVGGDFWDVVALPSGEAALAVGDVAGHDMVAAATMVQLRSAARALRTQADGPARLVELLQGCWEQLALGRIATALFTRLDPSDGRLRVASAGHPPPLLVRPGQVGFATLRPAPPLGASGPAPQEWCTTLAPGDSMVLYTDGLVEDRRRTIDAGMERLRLAAAEAADLPPAAMADHLLGRLLGDERGDDVALVVVRR